MKLLRWGKGRNFISQTLRDGTPQVQIKTSHLVGKQNLHEIMKTGTGSIWLRKCTSVTEYIREFNVPRNTGIISDMFSRRHFPENGGLGPFSVICECLLTFQNYLLHSITPQLPWAAVILRATGPSKPKLTE